MSALDIEGVLAAKFWNHSEEYIAHVAAVLREQIAAAWDEGWATGMGDSAMLSNGQAEHVTPNPYRAALVAPSRVPGEES